MPSTPKIIRSKRKTIALVIQPNGELLIRAPKRATRKQIDAMLKQHANWITKKQAKAKAAQIDFSPRQFVGGEEFPFLGEDYSLKIVKAKKPVLALSGDFQLSEASLGKAESIFERWYKGEARAIFTERVEFYAQKYDFDYAKIKLSSARTRWGSCSSKGNLNLTWRLVMAPMKIVDYVIVHELSHLREHNHSKTFWAQVEAILPDYKSRRKWLKGNGRRFHFP
ncbi:MAG: M48 family metallopeptidase [Anaerolineae bacterium]|jgi:hypothetical protein|nr:M48 family metallopeptidase [Anaerolineae bacterium]MBT4311977.1 M48 family metallopeptidase [Anaerolineae bacterium]MBT4458125.1 M48 family metallopeptidase [Anaerolineae bacterium]MBT6059564.1 M48 family metallopeptidase [Anaerolineae bacterium]MBT6322816.1 M48 family metallopeptidase [Anaerolineae bacterium]